MRTCPNCGYQVENDRAKFCKQCGTDLSLLPRRPSQAKPAASGKPAVARRDAKDSGKRKTRRLWYVNAAFVAVGLALCVLLFLPGGGNERTPDETAPIGHSSFAADSVAIEEVEAVEDSVAFDTVAVDRELERRSAETSALYACDECGLRFKTAAELWRHKEMKHPVLFSCDRCDLKFKTEAELAKHKENAHSFPCDKCGMRFETETELVSHKRDYHPVTFICYVCGAKFENAAEFQQHNATAHRPAYRCDGCGMTFGSEAELRGHSHGKLPRLGR